MMRKPMSMQYTTSAQETENILIRVRSSLTPNNLDEDIAKAFNKLQAENERLREALKFYADGDHFNPVCREDWDSVSGESENLLEDDCNTVTIKDGSIARAAMKETL